MTGAESEFEWSSADDLDDGVAFADVTGVFEDERAVTLDDDRHDEARQLTLGRDNLGRIVVVAWTWREDNIRVISARTALPSEVRVYES